jgi:hypothetical protein
LPLGVVFSWLFRNCVTCEMHACGNSHGGKPSMKWECPFLTVCLQWIELVGKCFWDFDVKNVLQGWEMYCVVN